MVYLRKAALLAVLLFTAVTWGCADLRQKLADAQVPCPCEEVEALKYFGSWQGGVVGTEPHEVVTGTLAEIKERSSAKVVQYNKMVEYRSEDKTYYYSANPEGYDPATKCFKIREKVFEKDQPITDVVKKVCPDTKG